MPRRVQGRPPAGPADHESTANNDSRLPGCCRVPVVPKPVRVRTPASSRSTANVSRKRCSLIGAFYPALNLTGAGGLQGSGFASLFSLPGIFWSLGASASQIIFDAGLRKATVAQYTAAYNADVASYKQTVLTAFQQVEDSIAALRVVSQQIEREQEALQAAQRFMNLETARYETGLDPYLNVLSAQVTLLSNQLTDVALHVNEMTAAVQLVQALGGGWNGGDLPAPSKVTSAEAARQAAAVP